MSESKLSSIFHRIVGFFKPSIVINVFGKNYSKRVLISYVTYPYFKKIDDFSHTNYQESYGIAQVFDELGFIVDVVDYYYSGSIDYDKYHVIFGFEKPLENYFYKYSGKKLISIFYGTGRHPYASGPASLKRIVDVYKKKGVIMLDSARIVRTDYSIQTTLPNAIFSLGNDYCAYSWKYYSKNKVYAIPASFYKTLNYQSIIEAKDFQTAKRNYLWMGSAGLVHKGLDLLLEAFALMPELHLYICNNLNEKKFVSVYEKELNMPNIHRMGFVLMGTKQYSDVMSKCAFVIYPSCSEGGSPPVVAAMGNGGLIPIVSKEGTIDIGQSGFLINDLTVKSILSVLKKTQSLNEEQIVTLSRRAGSYSNANNSFVSFKKQIKLSLLDVFKDNDFKL